MSTNFAELDGRYFSASLDDDTSEFKGIARDAIERVEELEDLIFGVVSELPEGDDLKAIKSLPALRKLVERVREQLEDEA